MKKIISIFVTLTMTLLLFVGCNKAPTVTNSAESKVEVKLTGSITFGTNFIGDPGKDLPAIAQKFMDENPGVTVAFEGIKDPESVLKLRMASNELPDIGLILPTIVSKDLPNYYMPLDELGYTADDVYFFNSGVVDGKLYKIPDSVYYDGIVYNKKAFAEAGITKVPLTVEEFYAACQKLKDKGIIAYGSFFKDGWPLMHWTQRAYPYEAAGSEQAMNDLMKTDNFISGSLLAGLNILRTMAEKGYMEPDYLTSDWATGNKKLFTGEIGMSYLGTWEPPQAESLGGKVEDVGMFPAPGVKGVSTKAGWFFGIAKNTKSPELAKAFMNYCWDDGAYCTATNQSSPMKKIKASGAYIDELLSYGVPVLEVNPNEDDLNAILNKAEVDIAVRVPQDYIVSKDPAAYIDGLNKKIAAAKESLGK